MFPVRKDEKEKIPVIKRRSSIERKKADWVDGWRKMVGVWAKKNPARKTFTLGNV